MAKTKVHGEYLDASVISGQTQVTAVGADSVLIFDATDNALKKALLSDVIETVADGDISTAKIADDAVTSAKIDTNIDIAGTFDVTGATTLDSTLGIGVASPEGLFEIEDGGTSKDILQKITLDDDNLYGLVIGNDSYSTTLADGFAVTVGNSGLVGLQARGTGSELAFRTVGAERVRIDSSGKVGIGTTSPVLDLQVGAAATGVDANMFLAAGTNAYSRLYMGDATTGTGLYAGLLMYDHGNDVMSLFTSSTQRVTIDSSGNVGIGNTNPGDYSADANNLVVGSLTGNNGITILSTPSAGYGSIYFADATTNNKVYAGYIRYQQDNSIMTFGINETERMRIQLNGGISFNGDTATANALDDYEEGGWTPTATTSNDNGSFSVTVNYAKYIKVGSLVHASCYLSINVSNVGSGAAIIGGLPFVNTSGQGYSIASVGHASAVAYETDHSVVAYVTNGHSYIRHVQGTSTGNVGWVAGNPKYYMMSCTYHSV